MNIKEIKEMINLMNENNLTELEIEKDGNRIRLKKGPSGEIALEQLKDNSTYSAPTVVYPATPRAAAPGKENPAEKSGVSKTAEVKAPMVGTFYRAPSPETPAFVEIGQTIEIGQVICIIEAMKLMNEIKSEIRGKIVDILVDNAEPVEFGQPLFLIEPA
ncbi:MAG: acetyl-CoA carboxylase biotin carboxyl carrier protein [Candidatus Omnitrophota bacterium]